MEFVAQTIFEKIEHILAVVSYECYRLVVFFGRNALSNRLFVLWLLRGCRDYLCLWSFVRCRKSGSRIFIIGCGFRSRNRQRVRIFDDRYLNDEHTSLPGVVLYADRAIVDIDVFFYKAQAYSVAHSCGLVGIFSGLIEAFEDVGFVAVLDADSCVGHFYDDIGIGLFD